jgi:hypothetical protein
VTSLGRVLAIAMLLGMVLLGAGSAVHPVLAGDAAAQLRTIAAMRAWRTMHLLMLAGSGLIIAGIWVRFITHRPLRDVGTATTSGAVATTSGATAATSAALVAALGLVTLGLAVNALNIGYMAGAGWHMAAQYAAGRAEMAALFEATHPIGLVAARFGNLIVALGALVLGWVEWSDPSRPRWLAVLAWIAAAGGLVGVIFFDEASRLVLGAVALLSGWELATAVRALRGDAPAP